ncbi:MAG: Ig-like domain-containing protein, partial [Alphaproteobacteria bacterium]
MAFPLQLGGVQNDGSRSVAIGPGDALAVTGTFLQSGDFDPGTGTFILTGDANPATNPFVTQLTPFGTHVSSLGIHTPPPFDLAETGWGVAFDAAGSLYAVGDFAGTADIDPGTGVTVLTGASGLAAYVVKLSPTGALDHAFAFDGFGTQSARAVATDGTDAVVVGRFGATVDFDPGPGVADLAAPGGAANAFIVRLTGDGDHLWSGGFLGPGNVGGHTVAIDPSGDIVVGGDYAGTIDFDPGPDVTTLINAAASLEGYVAKLDGATGALDWVREFEGYGETVNVTGVATDAAGNVVAVGRFNETVDLDPGGAIVNATAAGAQPFFDGFVVKLDSAGTFLWGGRIGGGNTDGATGVAIDSQGDVIVVGNVAQTADLDPTPGGVFNVTAQGAGDAFVLKLDGTTGALDWGHRLGGTSLDQATGVAIDGSDRIVVSGDFRTTADFGPGTETALLTTAGGSDVFVVRLDPDGTLSGDSPSTTAPDLIAADDSGDSPSDDITNVQSPTFTGSASPSTVTVELREGMTVLGTVAPGPDGTWSIMSSVLSEGVHTVHARAIAVDMTFADSGTLVVTIDTMIQVSDPDLHPSSDTGASDTDDVTSDTTPTFFGTGDAGDTISVVEGGMRLGSAVVDAMGNWTITTLAPLAEGSHTVHTTATDLAGNTAMGGDLVFVVDTTPPAVSVPDLDPGSDGGASDMDDVTNDATPLLTGTVEAGATVEILDGGMVIGMATVMGGTWAFEPGAPLGDGTHMFAARATDAAGNVATSEDLDVLIDTMIQVGTPDLDAGSDTGLSTSDDITADTTPTFTGTGDAGDTVSLVEGMTTLGSAVVDGLGMWSITSSALAEGVHMVAAMATDLAGNTDLSATLAVTVDTTPPALTGPDLDALSDTGASDMDDVTSDNTPTFTGTTEAGMTVNLFDGMAHLGMTVADALGVWSFTVAAPLADGVRDIRASAADVAGNTTFAGPLAVTIDTMIMVGPPDLHPDSDSGSSDSDDLTNDATPTFTGTGDPGDTVSLVEGMTTLGSAVVDMMGQWSITSSALAEGVHMVSAVAEDLAGNTDTAGPLAVTVDLTPPAVTVPDLDPASDTGTSDSDDITGDNTPTLTGTTEVGATVEILDGMAVLGMAVVDGMGGWTFTPGAPLADGGHSFAARATDAAGNSATSGALGVTIDATPPALAFFFSPNEDRNYGPGEVITIDAVFSETVDLTGMPTLTLDSGGTATFVGGDLTDTLTFTYTVAPGDRKS